MTTTATRNVWIPIESELPPLEMPVWLYLPNIRQPVIGFRSDGGEGWLWCRCYDGFWYDGEWKADISEDEDDKPSHWMPLPVPPEQTDIAQEESHAQTHRSP